MDAATNPFSPGAGTPPPELAGRQGIIDNATTALRRSITGRTARSQLLLGLRGVGKTVLLNRIDEIARSDGFETIVLEAPEDRRLVEMLVPPMRTRLISLSRTEGAKDFARRALGILRAFASVFRAKVGDIEFGVEPAEGIADSGNLESDLPELLLEVARAARAANKAVALLIDEVQYLPEEDLRALIVSIHKLSQQTLPFVLFGAGLPQLAALAGDAKSYAERLFDYPEVGPLGIDASRTAIITPIQREGAGIEDAAFDEIMHRTQGYPYFLQEWGANVWNVARGPTITLDDAQRATARALAALDKGFFRVRLDRLTPRQKDYMRAMAELGPGPHRSGEIAAKLGVLVTSAAPIRNNLIKKGMIYSPQHGDTAFTVPMFDEFMRRTMPDWHP